MENPWRVAALVAVVALGLVYNTADGMPFASEALVELEEGSPVSDMVATINSKVHKEEAKERAALKAHHMDSIKAGLDQEINKATEKENMKAAAFSQRWGAEVKKKEAKKAPKKAVPKGKKAAARAKVMAMLKESNDDVHKAEQDDGEHDVRESNSKQGDQIEDAINGRESNEEQNADTSVNEMKQLISEDENADMEKAGESIAAPEDPLDQAIDSISVVRHREHQKVLVAHQLAEAKRSMELAESNDDMPEGDNFLEEDGTPANPPGPSADGKPTAVKTGPPPKKQPPVVSNRKKIPKSEPLARNTPKADTTNLDAGLMANRPNATTHAGVKSKKPVDVTGGMTFSKEEVDKEINAIEGHMTHAEASKEGEKQFKPWHLRNETNTKNAPKMVPESALKNKAATPTLPKAGAKPGNTAPSNAAPTNSSEAFRELGF